MRNAFELVGTGFGVVQSAFIVAFGSAFSVAVGRSVVSALVASVSLFSLLAPFRWVFVCFLCVFFGLLVAVGNGSRDAFATEDSSFWGKTVIMTMGVPSSGHDSSKGVCFA